LLSSRACFLFRLTYQNYFFLTVKSPTIFDHIT
jgi:hypothetical protein